MPSVKVRQALILNDFVQEGSTVADQTLFAATNVQSSRDVDFADGYGADVLWEIGGGGVDVRYAYGYIYSDSDVWVELRNEAGTAQFMRFFAPANVLVYVPGKFGSGTATAFDGALLADNTDYHDVDRVEVLNNVAGGGGRAKVSLYLFM